MEIKKIHSNMEVDILPTGDHKRILQTEDFQISIDPGFDFVDKEYVARKHNVTLGFKKIQN